jgi:hypothetical protein
MNLPVRFGSGVTFAPSFPIAVFNAMVPTVLRARRDYGWIGGTLPLPIVTVFPPWFRVRLS